MWWTHTQGITPDLKADLKTFIHATPTPHNFCVTRVGDKWFNDPHTLVLLACSPAANKTDLGPWALVLFFFLDTKRR